MSCEGTTDDQIGEAVLIGVIKDQVRHITCEGNIPPLRLPDMKPITNENDQMLVDQIAETIRVIGDRLDQDPRFNDMMDGLGRVADKSCFWKLVENVFSNGQINWGRIIVLFYSVGKLSAKMVLARLPAVVSDILSLCLDFFRRKLLDWICNMGGWINSISELARFAIEQVSTSSIRTISPSVALGLVFISGSTSGDAHQLEMNRIS
ncbi:BCL2 associated X, apoptosis regulator b [Electrophorus electricus]|uniref:Bcl-2 Bcl-2 homology region 1-3 domain-containing protein n=1 Tax=Electrophorus electricus TaxID=8005 RepID=A0A4W4GCH1_ELEEL|nr:BCL2 associated X, apoptosis regulator b [Electrophorus electricus]XP_026870512.2 BCL2 associated X, apoptosis regulator b [Electrophorus electricus]XP_026870514.2 BCL2 associated X, apoptosis regulator b [Electrophorus electricus]